MDQDAASATHGSRKRIPLMRSAGLASVAVAALAIGAASEAPAVSPAVAQTASANLPAPPANGVMGFVVWHFNPPVVQGKDACPEGVALKNREIFLSTLSPEEQTRLQKKENEKEFGQLWRNSMMHPDGANICSQYSQFPERPIQRTVQSKFAWGINLDGDDGDGAKNPAGCAHQNFETPDGQKGIDNQSYRAMGCNLEWRGVDGTAGDMVRGFEGFIASGEWAQVILLRGVDSLVNDNDVEIVYGNTPDRPVVDSAGKYIWNVSYTISTVMPRERNVLHGKIVNGVLTTDPAPIKLAQTWGQGGARDLRGVRSHWTLKRGRLRLTFQPDGTLKGFIGGYQPLEEFVDSTSMGGLGSAMVAGIDCAGQWNTLRKLADGDRDPKTGQCSTISSALELSAVPAFVNDIAPNAKQKIASK
jgi:hypothetical protein